MVKILMGRVSDVIPKTYMPILRLVCDDPDKADADYAADVVTLREPVRLLDSPREKWRKLYGSYIRELEWVYGELRQHFPTPRVPGPRHRHHGAHHPELAGQPIRATASSRPRASSVRRRLFGRQDPSLRRARSTSWLARKMAAHGMEKSDGNGPIGKWFLSNLNPGELHGRPRRDER